jgi:hypothetical protein
MEANLATFTEVAAKAQKILGVKAKVPKQLAPTILTANKSAVTADDKYDAAVKQLGTAILDRQNAVSSILNAAKQYSNQIAKDDFGMDTKADDYKKKRADAQKLFDGFFDDATKRLQGTVKDLDELDKHLDDLKGYKSPPNPVDK